MRSDSPDHRKRAGRSVRRRWRGSIATVLLIAAATSLGTAAPASAATVADAPLTIAGVPVDVVRGTPLTNQRVATFTDADPAGTLSDYSATINWGDGNTTAGTVVANPGGGFAVNGSHSYIAATTYSVAITVHDVGGAT